MTDFLLLTFYAPLASWGDIAVGEIRGSWDRPSRSAVLGILAAGLGVDRLDQEQHDALDRGYGVAVRLDAVGPSMVDYHTVQTVSQAVVKRVSGSPRRIGLEAEEPGTLLSRRTYRQDSLATVAIWARDGARWTLRELADAVLRPTYTLYAGRKSNPFGLPLNPEVVSAGSLAVALAQRSNPLQGHPGADRALRPASPVQVTHDPCDGFPSGLRPHQTIVRRDGQPNRTRWQFLERTVEVGLFDEGGER